MTDFNTILVKDKLAKDDAFASLTLNPTLRWLKFILTDDQPNGNKQRIPQEEFDNLIKSGINMPIKMADGDIADGHPGSKPIGVITHLKQVANKIEGLAALWSSERPDDVDLIIDEFESGSPPQISWEVPYDDEIIGDDGVSTLKGIILRAATLVRFPAFEGRTPVLAVAAKEIKPIEAEAEIKEVIDMSDDKIKELETKLAEATTKIADLEGKLKEKTEGFASIEVELTDLREFKAQADKDADEAEKLDSIRTKFAEAGIEKPDEYFDENKERFLALDEAGQDFMVQEMSAFAKTSVATASLEGGEGGEEEEEEEEGLPAIVNTEGVVDILADPKQAGKMLRENRQKKQ